VEDWAQRLAAKGCTPRHVAQSAARVRRLCAEARIHALPDMTGDRVAAWLAANSDKASHRTLRFYLCAAKQFVRWLPREGRVAANPLLHLAVSTKGSGRERRALSAAGVHPSVAQALARHSDVCLTLGTYTHSRWESMAEAVAKLPSLDARAAQQQRATGTCDAPETAAPFSSHSGRSSVHHDAHNKPAADNPQPVESTLETTTFTGIFTMPPAGFEPATYGLGNRCSIP
jgi:hypothetical protein